MFPPPGRCHYKSFFRFATFNTDVSCSVYYTYMFLYNYIPLVCYRVFVWTTNILQTPPNKYFVLSPFSVDWSRKRCGCKIVANHDKPWKNDQHFILFNWMVWKNVVGKYLRSWKSLLFVIFFLWLLAVQKASICFDKYFKCLKSKI